MLHCLGDAVASGTKQKTEDFEVR